MSMAACCVKTLLAFQLQFEKAVVADYFQRNKYIQLSQYIMFFYCKVECTFKGLMNHSGRGVGELFFDCKESMVF